MVREKWEDNPITQTGPSFAGVGPVSRGTDQGVGGHGPGLSQADRGLAARVASTASRPARVAQAAAAAPRTAPQPPADSRTIRIVDNDLFQSLPADVRQTAVDEVKRIWSFVAKAGRGKAMKVLLVTPDKFPETYAFTDAVVSLVQAETDLGAQIGQSLKVQGDNAVASLRGLVSLNNPFTHFTSNPERLGVAAQEKIVVSGRTDRFALPFMAAAVALDGIIGEALQKLESLINVKQAREKRAKPRNTPSPGTKEPPVVDAKYFASHQALIDTAVLSALDNPTDPNKWIAGRDRLGKGIGRVMAHELRHLYMPGPPAPAHADTGLGFDAPDIMDDTNYSDFSKVDQKDIIAAIDKLEKVQRGTIVVATFPTSRRDAFPF